MKDAEKFRAMFNGYLLPWKKFVRAERFVRLYYCAIRTRLLQRWRTMPNITTEPVPDLPA